VAEEALMPRTDRTAARPVIAVTAEDDRFRSTRMRGEQAAADSGAPLLLYDWDAPTLFGDPLPTWWSSEGSQDRFGDRLDADQLDEVGRATIGDQVREATQRGVPAWGWLPSDHGPEALARYARAQQARVVVVPEDLPDLPALKTRLAGPDGPEAAEAASPGARILAV
jgi:hypothetical protein